MTPPPPDARLAALLDRAAARASAFALDVLPGPPVGCTVLDRSGRVVGEGAYRRWGGAHAEAEALRGAGAAARGGTALVTLEPCADGPGKRTPSCAAALAAAGVARVAYAGEDPGDHAGGAGPALLRAAGIRVDRVRSDAAEASLARWRAGAGDPLPWCLAKWAMSLDGRTGDARGGSRWITGEAARARGHALRASCDAVVVGARTAALDDPDLRPAGGLPGPTPLRVVVDGALRLSPASRLARSAGEAPVLAACGAAADPARRARLEAAGVEVAAFPGEGGRVDLRALLLALRDRGCRRVLLEGGGELAAAALRAGCVRQVAAFVAPILVGGRTAPSPLAGEGLLFAVPGAPRLEELRLERLGDDLLVEGFVPR